ncbi:putative violet-sensitive opsin [Dissostichus eleginoides]|uniref:Rhodopsin n=1 Tax=Dissostichus eleginoides TaxID=100907 RepID=A0AAD9EN69_DISEL|nr:putative violet-sensitive opsin [Dissostichus eleginoides]
MGKDFHLYENVSNISPFEGPQYHLAPRWAFHLQTIFMGLVFLAGTPLNLLVLFVTLKHKKLRVPLNYILVNVSAAGFIFVTFSVSQVFISSTRGYFFLGHTMCSLESAMGSIAGLVTPLGAFTFTNNHALAAVAFTWFMGVGCAIPPFFGWSRYIPEGLGCACGPDWYTHNEEFHCTSYTAFLMVTCFISPLSIIIFCYAQLLMTLKAVAAQQAESVSTQKAEKEVSRMIVVMVGSFLVCYGPYALAALYFAYSTEQNKDYRLVAIPALFSKSSCVYNPLIYAFMNKQFKGCIMETVFGKNTEDDSKVSTSKTEVSSVS